VIRDVKGVTSLLDRRFGSAAGRPMSLVRTVVWIVAGIYLIGLLFPAPKVHLNKTYYNRHLPTTAVRDLVIDKNDPRGWLHRKKDPAKFTIAWVGTSTMQNVAPGPYTFIPADVQKEIPEIDGKPVQVNMYLFEGGRMMDLYAATEDALDTEPDLIMLDMNPLWLFNDRQIQEWDNLDTAAFTDMIRHVSGLPVVASLYSPSDAALGLAATHLSAIRDRWSYAEKLRDEIDKLSPLNPPTVDPKAKPAPRTGLALVASMPSPLAFWNYYRPLVPLSSNPLPLQEALLIGSKTDGSLINDDIDGALLGSLADSKIPAIAYMPPIAPNALADPGVDSALHRVENHIKQIADQHKSATLLVKSTSASRFVSGLKFKDIGHMTYSTPMVNYLGRLICSHLKSVDPSTQCTAIPKAVTP
jgi:hypothetical protein